jgi:hypothetical protein
MILPGTYEVRVEVVGYRPLVARSVDIGGGERADVSLTINPAAPPVVTIDTVALGVSTSQRVRNEGVRLGDGLVTGLPSRFDDVASIVALSPVFDQSLGSQGLPGDMSLVVADGVPFYRAPHPTARSELVPLALFPRSSVAALTARHNAPDIESAGAAGGVISLATRSSTTDGGVELDASYGGAETWSTGEPGFTDPSLTSLQFGARATVPLSPDVSQMHVAGEVVRQQTPLALRVSESLAGDLTGLDADLLADLTESGVETYGRYSGLARVDIRRSSSTHIFFRGGASLTRREFEGSGPVSLARRTAPAEESIDFSVAGGVVGESSDEVAIELRGGVSGSYRTFDPAAEGLAPAFLAGERAALGGLSSAPGESARTDVVLLPLLRYSPRTYTLKIGGSARLTSHRMAHSWASAGDFAYSDAAAVLAGRGFGQSSFLPEESFATSEFGLFAQYESTLGDDVRITLGGRYDYERIPAADIVANQSWFVATGVSNDSIRGTFHQLGLRGAFQWTPATAGTSVTVTGALHNGDLDPRATYQLLADDTRGTSSRFAGTGLDWPGAVVPSTTALPTLTLFGPDVRPPRSVNVDVDLSQRVTEGVSLHARGSLRRTDFILRRRNLNLPVTAQFMDPNGRAMYGTLAHDGALVTTTADDARRFSSFGEVWALDPDGWSEYRGVTAGIEAGGSAFDLYASYTISETTDNWVGASTGLLDATLDPMLPEPSSDEPWAEGTSDYDVPHRLAAAARIRFGGATLSALYRLESGRPFTPRYRYGVDANGDGSARNDAAFVPADTQLGSVLDDWRCLESQAGMFATRNSCRGPRTHSIDARFQVTLGRLGGRAVRVTIDGLDLIESDGGVRDEALLVVDPAGSITTSSDGSTVTIPVSVNPGFGEIVYPSTRGRTLRIGLRVGA